MVLRVWTALAVFAGLMLAAGVSPALGCRYEARPLAESVAAAQDGFIGTVDTVENGLAILHVQKSLRDKPGDTLEVEISQESCAIRFAPGQRWLYLGPDHPSGSLLLRDENGVEITANIAAAEKATGAALPADDRISAGTMERSCAPWDGTAYMVTLENGISATVYSALANAPKENAPPVTFQADGKAARDHGRIVTCPQTDDGKPTDIPCAAQTGTITFGLVTQDSAAGRIDIEYGEHHSRHVFRVKRVSKQVFCG